jgi:FMN phosphatase YigB (HAD superfamily)
MNLILFDLGGTLIDDPFEEVLHMLYAECLEGCHSLSLEKNDLADFFNYWREENLKTDYPFASHFLQEETWPIRGLMRLNRARGVPLAAEIPLLSLTILKRYRELARLQISVQPQLPLLKEIFTWLKRVGAVIGVASNDREFATKTMLVWADLAEYLDWVFTSEELSKKYPKAEKPAPEFFRAIFAEIKRPLSEWDHVVYVGDSEKNDILPARSLGICTVRYLNKRTPLDTLWIDSTVESVADYQCSDRKQLLSIFRKILKK